MQQKTVDSFFLALKVGLGVTEPTKATTSSLANLPFKEWKVLMDLAARQGVVAIFYDGLQKVYNCWEKEMYAVSEDSNKWITLIMSYGSLAAKTELQNKKQRSAITKISDLVARKGVKMMVFKGQANSTFYPNPLHRAVGDIDCYMYGEADKGDVCLAKMGAQIDNDWYRHSKISFLGETIENHRFFAYTRTGKKGKMMEKDFLSYLQKTKTNTIPDCGVALAPTTLFNATFLSYHAMMHFLSGGFGMKQILDWAMFLREYQNRIEWERFYSFCDKYNLRLFAEAMTSIAVEYIGVSSEGIPSYSKSQFTDKVLMDALSHTTEPYRSKWKERMSRAWNMLTCNRWKYREICQQNVFKVFCMSVIGFVFKTEED